MARIYSFETGEIIHDSTYKEPVLRRLLGRSAGRSSLKLTEESIQASKDRVDEAIRIGIAVYQARVDYQTPRSDMTEEEMMHLIAAEQDTLGQLSPAEKQHVTEYVRSVTRPTEQEIS